MSKTPYNVMVKSDIVGRLKKIRDGVVYSNVLTFIFELIQNCQRAKATRVDIYVYDDRIDIIDNGIGCEDPEVLFTLDVSGFKVGFGEGFSSIYTIADYFEVETLHWKGSLDVVKAMKTKKADDLRVPIEHLLNYREGFKVSIQGDKIQEYSQSIIEKATSICSIIPNIDFYINGNKVEHVDLLAPPSSYEKYQVRFDNRIYEGRLWLNKTSSYGTVQVYYDYRHVCAVYENGINGVIHIKPNKINLKAPDRKAIIYDSKERNLLRQLRKDAEYLSQKVLLSGNSEDIEEYSDVILHYNDIKKVISHLQVDGGKILNQYETRNKANEEEIVDTSVNETDYEESKYQDTEFNKNLDNLNEVAKSLPGLNEIKQSFENPTGVRKGIVRKSVDKEDSSSSEEATQRHSDTKRNQEDQSFSSFVSSKPRTSMIKKEDMNKVSIRNIAKKSNIVWVEKKYKDDRQDLINLYEYYGIHTFISPHVLFDRALEFLEVPHIDSVKDTAIEKQYSVTNIGAKKRKDGSTSKKEERVIEILEYIERKLGIGKTFYISDIKCKMIVSLRDTKIYQEDLQIEGYAQGSIIHLNRKSLEFGDISSILLGRDKLSIHDVMFVLSNLELLAHELAHLIYGTKDNTKEHFMAQNELQKQIAKIIRECKSLSA